VKRARQDALKQLVREARDQQPRELDWERAEERLLSKLSALEPTPHEPPRWLAWSGVALAAAAAYGIFALRSRPAPPAEARSAPAAVSQPLAVNGDQLQLAQSLVAGAERRVVEHAGRARWTLEPSSSAHLSELGEHLTVTLESGSLSAQITPSQQPETFAVEVGRTRFAVHGTAFRVQRSGDRVTLEVSEGIVAVEPVGQRGSAEFLLRAASRGEFALDGRTGKVEGNASVVTGVAGVSSRHAVPRAASGPQPGRNSASVPPASSVPSAVGEPALPAQLSIGAVESGVSAAVEIVSQCFRNETRANGIQIAVKTGMTLHVTGEGDVDDVEFGPALAPSVEACAVQGLRTITFARSLEGARFTRILELVR
jgi:ferric-dicitrate binding protein FerR (iron transport regulator)